MERGSDRRALRAAPGDHALALRQPPQLFQAQKEGIVRLPQDAVLHQPAGQFDDEAAAGPDAADPLRLGALTQRAERLRHLPGMSAKSEEKILQALEGIKNSGVRFRLDTAYETATQLSNYIRAFKGAEVVTAAGSLRRGQDTVGDLDLLVTGHGLGKLPEHLLKFPAIASVLARGDDKVSFKLATGMQVDGRILPAECFGAARLYFTGS